MNLLSRAYISLKSLKKNTWVVFFFLIIFPTALIILGLFTTIFFNFQNSKKQIQTGAISALKQMALESENKISNIIKSADFLSADSDILSVLNQRETTTTSASNGLKKFSLIFDLVDSLLIFNDQKVSTTESGIYSLEDYFTNIYQYANYTTDYWQRFKFYDTSAYRVLSPSVVQTAHGSKNIIPIVFRRLDTVRFKSYLVINLFLDELIAPKEFYPFTKNTQIYILNRYTGQVFSKNPDDSGFYILDSTIYRQLVGTSGSFDYEDERFSKSLISSYSTSDNLIGYTYFSVTPYRDIDSLLLPPLIFTLVFNMLFTFLAVLIALVSTKKVILPLKQLAGIFHFNTDEKSRDIVSIVKKAANEILARNINLSKALPFAQEKYLINYLNDTGYTIDEHTKEIIAKTLPFRHRFFSVVILQLYPTNTLYETYSNEAYTNIQSGFYNIIKEMFLEYFDAFFLSSEMETLYVILNFENEDNFGSIERILGDIKEYLSNDSDYIELFIGISNPYEELDGLKKAHKEALRALKITPKPPSQIILTPKNKNSIHYTFSDNDETKLFYLLSTFKIEEATEFIKNSANQNENIDSRSKKQLYAQIINIMLKVMRIKGIPYSNENKLDFEIISELLSSPVDVIYKKILSIIEKFSMNASNFMNKSENENIIGYINDNYCNSSLSLDYLATLFGTRANYISSLIKNRLGVGFHEYVTNLRISKAKTLLTETRSNVQEIYESIGYTNKQTFFRAFRTTTGMTPAEYRKKQV